MTANLSELDALLAKALPDGAVQRIDGNRVCDLLQAEALALASAGRTGQAAALAVRCAECFPADAWVANTAANIIQWHLHANDDPALLAAAKDLAARGSEAFAAYMSRTASTGDRPPPFVLATFLPKSGGTFIVAAMKRLFGYRDDIVYALGTGQNNVLVPARIKVLESVGGVIGHVHVSPTAENIAVIAASGQTLWVHLRDPRDSFCSLMSMMHRERERPDTVGRLYGDAEISTGRRIDELLSLDMPELARALWPHFVDYSTAVATWIAADLPRKFVTWHSELVASEEGFLCRVRDALGLGEAKSDAGLPEKNYATCRFNQGVNGRWRTFFDEEMKQRMTETMKQTAILAVCEGSASAPAAGERVRTVAGHAQQPARTFQDSLRARVVEPDLVFDIGLHTGKDAEFYLQKGFRVVAVEANAAMAERVRMCLGDHMAGGALTIVERALHEQDGRRVSFFVNDEKDDWSSLDRGAAEKGVTSSREVLVETITLSTLLSRYGVPYYLKCDIEGGDLAVATQLTRETVVPNFVSFEITSIAILAPLWSAGYRRFQLVNQAFNHLTKPPRPAAEGTFVDRLFDGHSSGLFGRELPADRWVDIDTAAELYLDFVRLRGRYSQFCMGWLDVHAAR